MTSTQPILAWHWIKADRTLRDGSPLVLGSKLVHTGKLSICKSGYHASERIIDALGYAPGPIVCRVECSGQFDRQNDKLVCTERKALWAVNAETALRAFARRCATDVAHLWDMPQIVREYLETGDESKRAAARAAALAAAWDAALAAAWAAARAAAWAAARDAALAAAWAAAWDAALAAAWDAALAAAWAAARAAARDANISQYNAWLEEMVVGAHEEAMK